MRFPSRKRKPPTIHLTALIDIVFLLLIFFLLTSNFVTQQGQTIQVPEVSTESAELLPDIMVRVDHAGSFYFNNVLVNDSILLRLLSQELARADKQHVAIQADRRVPYDRVVDAIDIAKQAGAKDFLLVTRQKHEK